jgi:hypothetical protein
MCLVKVKDFGDALGISGGTIRSKISRGQLLRNKNNLIDTENPINYIYLLEVNGGDQSVFESYSIKSIGRANVRKKVSLASKSVKKVTLSEKVVEIPQKPSQKPQKAVLEKPSKIKGSVKVAPTVEPKKIQEEIPFEKPEKLTEKEKQEQRDNAKARKELLDYDLRQKRANAEYKERESELKKMQLEKIAGNTLPLDLTKKILKINCQAILVQFLSSVENMVSVTVEELGGVRADNVRITNELKKIFKKTVENCEKNAEREIENAVAEYSDVRSRGERKA